MYPFWRTYGILVAVAIVLLMAIICSIRSGLRERKTALRPGDCTFKTVGFITHVQDTYIVEDEDKPILLITVTALNEQGRPITAKIRAVVSKSRLPLMVCGYPLAIKLNPRDMSKGILDSAPSQSRIQELFDRYNCFRHPSGPSYQERREIWETGELASAKVEDRQLTGREETGDYEVTLKIRITDGPMKDNAGRRTLFYPFDLLDHIEAGKSVQVRIIPAKPDHFAVVDCIHKFEYQ